MAFVLKEGIIRCFNELREKDFDDETMLKNLYESIKEYKEYNLQLKKDIKKASD